MFLWIHLIGQGRKDSLKIFKPTINDYQHYTQFSEKKIFDTVFTIDKSYQFTQYNNPRQLWKNPICQHWFWISDLIFLCQ